MAAAPRPYEPDTPHDGSLNAYVARQPIYDDRGAVTAYEILYRSGNFGDAGEVGLEESSTLLVNAIGTFGLDSLVGGKKAFVNVSTELLLAGVLSMLPQDRVVLEILENVAATPEVLAAVEALKSEGFLFALDDYCGQAELAPFLSHVKYVKLDVPGQQPTKFRPLIQLLASKGKTVLAEKVETRAEFEAWKAAGCKLFQGYFFARPEVMEGKSAVCNHAALVQLMSRISDPEIGLNELETIVINDPGLSYRLMKMVRSAAIGMPDRVQSVKEALFFVGLRKTKALATILLLSNVTGKSPELLLTALTRAHFAQSIAQELRLGADDAYFTMGLFSLLDALLDTNMEVLLEQLPLAEDVASALVDPDVDSDYGHVLRFIVNWERGIPAPLSGHGLSTEQCCTMYLQALKQATAIADGAKAE